MSRDITIVDCTLRDGSYACDFRFSEHDTATTCRALEGIGVKYIEVGHGCGLNASGPRYGVAAATDEQYLRAASGATSVSRCGAFCIPGIATMESLADARRHGASFVRIGTNVTESQDANPFIAYARELGLEVSYNAMKSYLATPEDIAKRLRNAQDHGAQVVYVVDSAGTMLPDEVRAMCEAVVAHVTAPLGFHGHDNLSLAVANSLAAVESGATFIDCTLGGIGRGGGNTPLETFAAVAERMGWRTNVDFCRAQDAARQLPLHQLREVESVRELDLAMGFAGFHSSMTRRILTAASLYNLDPRMLLIAVALRDRKDPDQSLINQVAVELASHPTPSRMAM